MTQHLDWLDCGEIEARQLTTAEIKAQMTEWKAHNDTLIPDEPEDTQPLSHAEIAAKQFEGRCLAILGGEKMTGGKLCDRNAFKVARYNLRREVGEVMADEIMSDFFASNNHLFI